MSAMFRIDRGESGTIHLRPSDVACLSWQRGHSYEKLQISMKSGQIFVLNDYAGSAYKIERALLAAIEAANG